jgi:hypothetical protein
MATRVLGSLALLAAGSVHLQQYLWLYSTIPTIGRLFLLHFAGSTLLGVGLLVPFERLLPRRGRIVADGLAAAAMLLAGVSLVLLAVAERRPLFGFMEPGFDPAAIQAARASEWATLALVGASLITRHLPFSSPRARRIREVIT